MAWLVNAGFPGAMAGVELNEEVAAYAKGWTDDHPNITLICGNAFDLNIDAYNVFYMGRPMEPDAFKAYVAKIESELTHPARLFYWWEQQSGPYLNDRPGWHLHRREWIHKIDGQYMCSFKQSYSTWTFTPRPMDD